MRRALIVVPVCVLAACQDVTLPEVPEATSTGAVAPGFGLSNLTAVPHFYFLPPLGPSPTPTAAFDANWAPAVEVCRLATSGACAEVVAWFTLDGSSHGTAVGIDVAGEHYHVNWNSGATSLPNGNYRLTVATARTHLSHRVFGTAELRLGSSMSSAAATATAGQVPMTNGSTLPVKFRIEVGALCPTTTCTHNTIDGNGGTVTNPEETAGVAVPPGAVTGTYNLFIEEYTGPNACLPTHQPQYLGCVTFRTEPAIAEFQQEVVVGVCLDPAALPFVDQMRLWKVSDHEADGPVNPPSLVELPRRIVDFLECENFMVAAHENPLLRGLSWAGRAMRPLANFFATPAHAKLPVPFGGGLADFSRVGWVRWLDITKVAGDNQTAIEGTAVGIDPTVKVTSRVTGEPVPGIAVEFVPSTGGTAAPPATVTDANGLASTQWTLAASLGIQTLVASGRNLLNTFPNRAGVWNSTTFSATAIVAPPPAPAYTVWFLSPLGTSAQSKSNVSTLQPVVEVCHLVGGSCGAVVASFANVAIASNKQSYSVNWNTPSTLVVGEYYRIRVLVGGVEVGQSTMRAVGSSKSTKEPFTFEVGRTLPIKFVLSAAP